MSKCSFLLIHNEMCNVGARLFFIRFYQSPFLSVINIEYNYPFCQEGYVFVLIFMVVCLSQSGYFRSYRQMT